MKRQIFKFNNQGSALIQTMLALSFLALTSGVTLSFLTSLLKKSTLEELQMDANNFKKLTINNLALPEHCTPAFINPVNIGGTEGANLSITSAAGDSRAFQIKLPFYTNWLPAYQGSSVDFDQSTIPDMNLSIEKVEFVQSDEGLNTGGERTVTGVLKLTSRSTLSALASSITRDLVTLKVTMDSLTGEFKSCYSYMSPEALCSSLGGKLAGRCMFQYRDLECPKGQYITSIDPDGTIHCENATFTCGDDAFVGITNGEATCRKVTFEKLEDITPVITTQPQGFTAQEGTYAPTLSVSAVGDNGGTSDGLTYRWQKDGADIVDPVLSGCSVPGAYSLNRCQFSNKIQLSHAGDYTVIVSNSMGTVVSNVATVEVTALPAPPPPPEVYFELAETIVQEKSDYPSFAWAPWDSNWDTYNWDNPVINVQVSLSQALSAPVNVSITYEGGTADVGGVCGNDLYFPTYNLIIPAGQTSVLFTGSVSFDLSGCDDFDEFTEEFANFKIATATSTAPGGVAISPTRNMHAVRIALPSEQVPNDIDWRGYPIVRYADGGGVVSEGTTKALVLKSNQLLASATTVNLNVYSPPGAAVRCGVAPCDFNLPTSATFAAGSKQTSVDLSVLDDGIADDNESITLQLPVWVSGIEVYGYDNLVLTARDPPPVP